MTGNQIKGKGFGGALRYNLEKVGKGVAEILDHSFVETSEKMIMKEIQMVKVLRPNLQKFFYHTSINFPPNEEITNELMKQIAHDYLKGNGFDQHQFIFFRHYDANHPHLHILVNRIGYDGKVLSDSNDFARSEKILRELEMKYNLTQVAPSKQAIKRAPTKDELEMMKRTNKPSSKLKLQCIIQKVIEDKPRLTTKEFIKALQNNNVNVLFNQASTGYVSGISYSYEGMVVTGSKLGSDFKWKVIKNSIDYDQQNDRVLIEETNVRTKVLNPHADVVYAKSGKRSKQPDQFIKTETIRSNKSTLENNVGFSLEMLLNNNSQENLIHTNHHLSLDVVNYLKLKKKKKRMGRRL